MQQYTLVGLNVCHRPISKTYPTTSEGYLRQGLSKKSMYIDVAAILGITLDPCMYHYADANRVLSIRGIAVCLVVFWLLHDCLLNPSMFSKFYRAMV
jgi:hypothetical protein